MEPGVLEDCIRDHLNQVAERRFAVLDPVKVVIENYPVGQVETMRAANHPSRAEAGERDVPFSRELWIEREDFMEDAPKKFFRMKPGGEA
jgi:glutaminyl-tRNA synthetase